ncbi:nucleotidyl transferase AbiEii/AbiGii toxin family protein [Paraneptunicella aestuarii]|uniref:nucleotidyl transferase AbiEii/AbiGii toxin family protein n=1 Tax=Paraneptunicella aestuarii TaxID=2831148 RepID=UPI001E4B605C|nr:nucleotidyl transferase AbiEii/AbiGii toxin family protein [Paraneptunicella aestuarii]UAA39282.1 nucleotidyl transferase AbiEii/AbiGii toxin family protein [Paraneptunicella aestuarii]
MKTTSLNVTGKLLKGMVELYQIIDAHAKALNIPYLVIGATARDIILHHGFKADIERGTRDIDFAIQVQSWEQFEQLKAKLLDNGFILHKEKAHQFITTVPNGEEWEIDIIPFGNIADDDQAITWPPKHDIAMKVTAFKEAFDNALNVTIVDNPSLEIKVASPAGMLLLKLISWLEREPGIRGKDAMDIYYLTKHYSKIPEIINAIYDEGFMENQDYDEHKACTMKLANDARSIADNKTLLFIAEQLLDNEAKLDNLTLDMHRGVKITYQTASELLTIIAEQLRAH